MNNRKAIQAVMKQSAIVRLTPEVVRGEWSTMAQQFLQGLLDAGLQAGVDPQILEGRVSLGDWGDVFFSIGDENIYIGLNNLQDTVMIKENPSGALSIVQSLWDLYQKAGSL